MWIYEIRNIKNDKKYIGQTIYADPFKRWIRHRSDLKCNRHRNEYLQRSWNKYGETAFEFTPLLKCKSQSELDKQEKRYIKKCRDSYNLTNGGSNGVQTAEVRERMRQIKLGTKRSSAALKKHSDSMKRRKYPISISDPNGNIHEIKMFKEFCRDHSLDAGAINRLLSGKVHSHKGWTLPDTEKLDWRIRLSRSRRAEEYPLLISPDGVITKIETLAEFSRKHNLNIASLHGVITKKRNHTKGWKLYDENISKG